jgi:hypothetical protein
MYNIHAVKLPINFLGSCGGTLWAVLRNINFV